MTNEFGAMLDRAGYAPSIMQTIRPGRCCCYLCGKPAGHEKMDRHEPYGGALRQKSKELGLWVELHHWGCHEGPGSAHDNGAVARQLRADAQRAAMLRYGWTREKWIEEFGKSELSEEECLELSVGQGERTATAAERPRNDEVTEDKPAGAGYDRERVGKLIRELWPDHQTTFRASGFCVVDGPELPY